MCSSKMLSRKQTWRKTRSETGKPIFKFCDKIGSDVEEEGMVESISDPDIQDHSSGGGSTVFDSFDCKKGVGGTGMKLRSALSMGDLSKSLRRAEDERNLRFSSTVHVCLIPTREDLSTTSQEVFWNTEDYQMFKKEAVDELRAYLQLKGITAKEAIQALYQPQPEELSSLRTLHVNSPDQREGAGDVDVDFDTRDVPSASGFKQRPNPPSEAVEVVRKSHSPTEEGGYSSTASDSSLDGSESGENIQLGFKTDLDMNKELGAIKTPARNGGQSGAWAVQWQAPS